MQTIFFLVALVFGAFVGVYYPMWGIARCAIYSAMVAAVISGIAAVLDGRHDVFAGHFARISMAIAVPAILVAVVRSYSS
jgi:hypothetical protein